MVYISIYYYGFKVKENLSIYELFQLFEKVKEEITPIALNELNMRWADFIGDIYATAMIDGVDNALSHLQKQYKTFKKGDNFTLLIRRMIEKHEESIVRQFYDFDFSCTAMIYPLKDKILVMFSTEVNEIRKYFEKNPNFEIYSYSNSTDGTDGLSTEEYNFIGEDWEKVFSKTYIKDKAGFNLTLINTAKLKPDMNKVLNYINNDYDKRLHTFAHYQIISTFAEAKSIPKTELFSFMMDVVETDEYKEEKKKQIEIFKEKIKPLTLTQVERFLP